MELFIQEKRVRLSVGEFAAYQCGPAESIRAAAPDPRRAQIGIQWHEALHREAAAESRGGRFEVSVSNNWIHKGWSFELQGRIDQLLPEGKSLRVREIKSLSLPLPLPPEELRQMHPEFFRQLAAYMALLSLDESAKGLSLSGEVVCVDARTGVRQVLPLDEDPVAIFTRQLDRMIPFLEDRLHSRIRLDSLEFQPAFTTLRPGQSLAREALFAAIDGAGKTAFEAPTGFGKTGLLLEAGLEQLRRGRFSRMIYLTGKSTGQWAVAAQLASMTRSGSLRFYQMRNRLEHAIQSPLHTCTPGARCEQPQAQQRWENAQIDIPSLFSKGTVDLEQVRELGRMHGLCPYEISRALMPYADIWLCDYNYLFSPGSRSFLENQFGFSPRDTLVVVDEAHNLPERVADAFSLCIEADFLVRLRDILSLAAAPRKTLLAAQNLSRFVAKIKPSAHMELGQAYELEELIQQLDEAIALSFGQMELDGLLEERGDVWEALFAPAQWLGFLSNERIGKLVWSASPERVDLTCLDASREIADVADRFGAVVYASATLSPAADFSQKIGEKADSLTWVSAKAPWHDGAFNLAIDARVDTRLSQRERYFAKTAQTICQFCEGMRAPLAVFFPSYQYAQNVAQYLALTNPFLRVNIQKKGLDLSAQTEFLEQSLLTSHALFLVLGGGFAEGIDLLGGRVSRAIVVGPALPELNPVQRAHIERYEQSADSVEAFRQACQIPAMRKINQALGRLVRAPGQKATILLHCRRFSQKPYLDLLNIPHSEIPVLHTDEEWIKWLEQWKDF